MIHLIKDFTDIFFSFLKDDPVRPNIPFEKRIGKNKDIFVLPENTDKINAITCVSYHNDIPSEEDELFIDSDKPVVAIFYTIWSYKSGAGRKLLLDTVNYINENNAVIQRFVTLSQKTEMAKRFHLSNGAIVLRENTNTINYEYVNDNHSNKLALLS